MDLKTKISVLFWLLIGVAGSIGGTKLGIGTFSNPQAGFMPFFVALLLILLSLLLAISEIRKVKLKSSTPFSISLNKDVLLVLCCFFVYILVLETLGYWISIFLFVFALLKLKAPKKWLGPLLFSIAVSSGTYFIFSVLLKCSLPRGIFII